MAFQISEYKENTTVEAKKYKGVTKGRIVAINPNKAECKEILGYEPQEEPAYYSKKAAKNIKGEDVEADNIKIDIFMKSEEESIDRTFKLTFFITNAPDFKQDGRVIVIDAYNNFACVDPKTIDNKKPIYRKRKNEDGSYSETNIINVHAGYRIARQGELDFRQFFAEFMQIAEPTVWDESSRMYIPKTGADLEASDSSFTDDDWKLMFKDFRNTSVFKAVNTRIKQEHNKLTFIAGIKITSDGKQYQEVMKNIRGAHRIKGYSDYDLNQMLKYNKNIDFADNGQLLPIHEYTVDNAPSTPEEVKKATEELDSNQGTTEDLPF